MPARAVLDREPIGVYHTSRASGVRTVTAWGDPSTGLPCSSVFLLITLVGVSSAHSTCSARSLGHRLIEPSRSQALGEAFQGAGNEPGRHRGAQQRRHQVRGPLGGHIALTGQQDRHSVDVRPVGHVPGRPQRRRRGSDLPAAAAPPPVRVGMGRVSQKRLDQPQDPLISDAFRSRSITAVCEISSKHAAMSPSNTHS
jgi:hypothetical protein